MRTPRARESSDNGNSIDAIVNHRQQRQQQHQHQHQFFFFVGHGATGTHGSCTGEARRASDAVGARRPRRRCLAPLMMLFGMHARAEHAEVLFQRRPQHRDTSAIRPSGPASSAPSRSTIRWRARRAVSSVSPRCARSASRRRLPPSAPSPTASSSSAIVHHAMRLLRSPRPRSSASTLPRPTCAPRSPPRQSRPLRQRARCPPSERDAALAAAAAICIDLAQRGALPSVNDADAVFHRDVRGAHKPRADVMAWGRAAAPRRRRLLRRRVGRRARAPQRGRGLAGVRRRAGGEHASRDRRRRRARRAADRLSRTRRPRSRRSSACRGARARAARRGAARRRAAARHVVGRCCA
jgi:hypothetical protein